MIEILLSVVATGLSAPAPPVVVVPPPIVSVVRTETGPGATRRLAMWKPGVVTCAGGGDPASVDLRRPYSTLVWGDGAGTKPLTLGFSIDTKGRPHSIAQVGWRSPTRDDWAAPALAASRFAPGPARSGCMISYTADIQPLDTAPLPEIASYVITRQTPALPSSGYDRMRPGDGCREGGKTQPLVMVHPEFAKIPATPGVRDWTLIRFDVDQQGKPFNIASLTGTGNAALEAAGVEAMGNWRFNKGSERRNCSYSFWRDPAVLPAPAMPPKETPKPGACGEGDWATAPRLQYPLAYKSRAIEGWAMISYDVAPWGEIGNVKVIESQPTEDFGSAASAMLQQARKAEGSGATGCRTSVIYRMAAAPKDEPAGDQTVF